MVRLLSVFLLNPGVSYYQQELARMVGGPLRPVQLALDKLVAASLVRKRHEGRQVYYEAVPEHPAFVDLASLFKKTFALGDAIRDALADVRDKIDVAFVYGSVASGEEVPGSDIDVFVVGAVGRREVSAALAAEQKRLQREINISLYTPQRLAKVHASGDHYVADVLEGSKVWLIGDERELERLAG